MRIWGLVAIIGLIISGIVARRPRLFWPMLIVVTVGTGGLMFQSLTFTDEILTGCVLLGGFMAASVGAIFLQRRREDAWTQLHKLIFLLMVIYMMIQSIRGWLILGGLRKIRWVVYYEMLGILLYSISQRNWSFTSGRKISFIVSSTALGYFSLYIAHGLFSEIVRGIRRYDLQNIEWSGTSAAMFPLAIAMPAVIFLFKDRNRIYRRIGWATLIIAIVAAFYYESRVAWLTILGFLIISMPTLGFRRFVCLSLIFLFFLGLFVSFIWPEWYDFKLFWEALLGSSKGLWAPPGEQYDSFRRTHMRIAFPIISSSWTTFLFGHGFRAAGPLIGEYAARLYAKYGYRQDFVDAVRQYQSTEGFTALVTETGLIGLLLLYLNFLFVARGIFIQKNSQNREILLLSLAITFLWLFVTNLLDFILFYLMIMPSGLLMQLSRCGAGEQVFEKQGKFKTRRGRRC